MSLFALLILVVGAGLTVFGAYVVSERRWVGAFGLVTGGALFLYGWGSLLGML